MIWASDKVLPYHNDELVEELLNRHDELSEDWRYDLQEFFDHSRNDEDEDEEDDPFIEVLDRYDEEFDCGDYYDWVSYGMRVATLAEVCHCIPPHIPLTEELCELLYFIKVERNAFEAQKIEEQKNEQEYQRSRIK